jgi:hypothetical protein
VLRHDERATHADIASLGRHPAGVLGGAKPHGEDAAGARLAPEVVPPLVSVPVHDLDPA